MPTSRRNPSRLEIASRILAGQANCGLPALLIEADDSHFGYSEDNRFIVQRALEYADELIKQHNATTEEGK